MKVKRALISVFKKDGLIPFASYLADNDVEIYSTGGTLKLLQQEGINAIAVEDYTQFPEMLDGRVKTLHPKIHAGILARKDNSQDLEVLEQHEILTFDLVCINLYPFADIIQGEGDWSDPDFKKKAIEMIDIGGPTMIRAAAKNHAHMAVIVSPNQYEGFVDHLKSNKGEVLSDYCQHLAFEAFQNTASYDATITHYFSSVLKQDFLDPYPVSLKKQQALRYGENPHQQASFYLPSSEELSWQQLHGKELSYNNILDLDAALQVGYDFTDPVCAIFKHTNPCGMAAGGDQLQNLERAIESDPVSSFGGIVLINQTIEKATAEKLIERFYEIIVAPDFSPEALEVLQTKKNLRLIKQFAKKTEVGKRWVSAAGGWLIQNENKILWDENKLSVPTEAAVSEEDKTQLFFAWKVVKHIKSNAIVFTKDQQTLGIGAGQMSRLDSMAFAIEKAKQAGLDLKGSYLASDAFFPFRDGIDLAIKAGVKAVVQPGGSIRDEEVIAAANEAKLPMLFTGMRHFRH
jgi:phosphoribosylaminoimidazolecarboxamide formyltransferase/IMP cyclohydrolase